jgi:hypothetical protein
MLLICGGEHGVKSHVFVLSFKLDKLYSCKQNHIGRPREGKYVRDWKGYKYIIISGKHDGLCYYRECIE